MGRGVRTLSLPLQGTTWRLLGPLRLSVSPVRNPPGVTFVDVISLAPLPTLVPTVWFIVFRALHPL